MGKHNIHEGMVVMVSMEIVMKEVEQMMMQLRMVLTMHGMVVQTW